MVSVISREECERARRVQGAMIGGYTAVAVVVVAANVLIAIFLQPVQSTWACVLNILLTAGLAVGTLFFFSVKFRIVHAYVRFYKGVEVGLKESSRGVFGGWIDETITKDGLECYAFVAIEAVKKRPDMPERQVLVEHTIEKPDFRPGDKLRYLTYGNMLVEYEIVERAPDPEATPATEAAPETDAPQPSDDAAPEREENDA